MYRGRPANFPNIRKYWTGKCNYAAKVQGGGNALCNQPKNSHSWQGTGFNPGFVCARGASFTRVLGGKNGQPTREYEFEISNLKSKAGKYADLMISACIAIKMKPVCEHRNYCGNDKYSIFIGQTHHLSYPAHRNNNKYSPSGFSGIRNNWKGLCNYAAKVQGGGNALCNRPINSHSWQGTGYNPGFMCAKGKTFQATLEAKNGVATTEYTFEAAWLRSKSGTYSAQMLVLCSAIGMKPVCEHRSYCGKDSKSLFIGQEHHLSYPPHRRNEGFVPRGFKAIESRWNGRCNYANNAASARGLCNIPGNTHSWRTPGQANPGFICGTTGLRTFVGYLGAKNGAQAREYRFSQVRLQEYNGKFAGIFCSYLCRPLNGIFTCNCWQT